MQRGHGDDRSYTAHTSDCDTGYCYCSDFDLQDYIYGARHTRRTAFKGNCAVTCSKCIMPIPAINDCYLDFGSGTNAAFDCNTGGFSAGTA